MDRTADETDVEAAKMAGDDATEDSKTRRLFDDPTTVRLSLAEGNEVPPHSHPDRTVVFYVVSGKFDVRLDGESHTLTEDEALRFDGDREVSPRAVEDSEALVIVT